MPVMVDPPPQSFAVASPSQMPECIIRTVWPSVAAHPAAAGLARSCYRTIILAPIGWLVLAPIYFKKFLAVAPGMSGLAVRYRLTNRQLMVCNGFRATPAKVIALDQIKDVKMVTDANSDFFMAATLDVFDLNGQIALSLPGVPEPESVRHAILQAVAAYGPAMSAAHR